jgi:nicotinate-nucleotide pyrophosphorylase (carboxylating)
VVRRLVERDVRERRLPGRSALMTSRTFQDESPLHGPPEIRKRTGDTLGSTPLDHDAVRRLVRLALAEDLGDRGDVTARIVPESCVARGDLVAREDGIIVGLELAREVLAEVEPRASFATELSDGARVAKATVVARVGGPARGVLSAERTMLNFLQRLSGIATATRRFVDLVQGTNARIYDTRKTTPGWRALAKYAVRMGGGVNHRMGLYDQVLIKDNHVALFGGEPAGIVSALARARREAPAGTLVEIEVNSVEGALAATRAGADIVLLDNMSPADMARAVREVRAQAAPARGPELEASGGVRLETVRRIAETGVDRVSVGWITHSAPSLDLALDLDLGGPIAT